MASIEVGLLLRRRREKSSKASWHLAEVGHAVSPTVSPVWPQNRGPRHVVRRLTEGFRWVFHKTTTDGRFDRFGPQNRGFVTTCGVGQKGLGGLATKPPRRRVSRFGPQNRGRTWCGRASGMEGTWRHREACVEAKQSREGGVSVRCSDKNMDRFAPAWAVILR